MYEVLCRPAVSCPIVVDCVARIEARSPVCKNGASDLSVSDDLEKQAAKVYLECDYGLLLVNVCDDR